MEEADFLRSLMARPDDRALRQSYADWLTDRGDPRSRVLFFEPPSDQLGLILSTFRRYNAIEYYFEDHPELKPLVEASKAAAEAIKRNDDYCREAKIDPEWRAIVDSLGNLFQPFFFRSSCLEPAELRDREKIT